MSSGFVGGYLLFSPASTKAALVRATLQAMELIPEAFEVKLPEDGLPLTSEEGYPLRTEEPPERALELLAQEEGGVIEGKGNKSAEAYWFEPAIASYQPILIWVYSRSMFSPEQTDHIESFARRWPLLCEQGQAVFGYFSPFEYMFERDYLQDQIFPALQTGDLSKLMATDCNWLIYLGPDLAKRWRGVQTPFPTPPIISQELPSGAHFFRARTDVFA